MMRTSLHWISLCAAALACAGPTPRTTATQAPGFVSVDVYGGLGGPKLVVAGGPRRVEMLIDLSSSMLERSPDGEAHAHAARSRAAELLYSLREETEVAIRTLGQADGDGCTPSVRVTEPAVVERREPLVERLADLQTSSESSLAAALSAVRRDLVLESASARARVVVFTDLDGSCGGDLCAAAEALIDTGAWLEIVNVGSAVPPACLEELQPSAAPSPSVTTSLPVAPTLFRVMRARDGSGSPPLLGEGAEGRGPIRVSSGLVMVEIALEPPEMIGPFKLRPGELARIRVLDAFDAALPTRVWRVERGAEPVASAFPPPPTLAPRAEKKSP